MKFEQALQLIRHPAIKFDHSTVWADLGSGSGLFTHALASLLSPHSRVYAVDKNIKLFEKWSNANEVNIINWQRNFENDDIDIRELDGILMANSFHFVFNKIEFIKKLKPLFKQEECFIIVEYDMDSPNPWVPYPVSFHSLKQLFIYISKAVTLSPY